MKITFLGAAETVTGSCYLVETEQTSFLVDCGMHQGHALEEEMNHAPFPFRMEDIDFMLLTHAHIDHSGRIPRLYVEGYRGPVFATQATAELCEIMLPDSGHIQEMEAEWQLRKNGRAGRKIEPALYTMEDAVNACKLFKPLKYNVTFTPAQDVRVVFRDAGHILGSAILEIWLTEEGKESKIVFSGDLGNRDMPILRDPTIIDSADYLIIESTYGDRLHADKTDKVEKFVGVINETIARGGNVIIPSFAVGRTQEVIYELNRAGDKYKDQRMAFMQTPVYIDSPLATSATKVFRENTDCFDEEARQYIADGNNPLDFPNLHFTRSADESKMLNQSDESKIIISASGMCNAGRIRHHLKHNLWRPESTVLFVGYQAHGTLGRQLVDGEKRVKIFGEEIIVRARIEANEGFSGHADQEGLLAWIGAMKQKPVKILLVHGEPEVINVFAETINRRFGLDAHVARLNETITLGAPVAQARLVVERLRDPRQVTTTYVLDTLQADLIHALEGFKDDVHEATTKEDLEAVLATLQERINETAGQLLAAHTIPKEP